MEYRLVLPAPPSTNHLYQPAPRRNSKGAYYVGRELRPEVRSYRELVQMVVLTKGRPHIPETGPLRLTLRLWVKRERDLDNAFKCLQDALAIALGFDDKRIVEQHGYKMIDAENPRAQVALAWD